VFPGHRKNTHDLIPFASPLLSILLFANITARVGRTASLYHVIVKEEVNAFLRAAFDDLIGVAAMLDESKARAVH
jgi:hypothetical protein